MKPVGIFDSGAGGLSILQALQKQSPDLDTIYLADTANFPLGEKPEATIRQAVNRGIEKLVDLNCGVVVLACNTASTVSLEQWQQYQAEVPILGVTPLLEEAADATETGKIVVFATLATLASSYFAAAKAALPEHLTIYAQAAFEWVRAVEAGDLYPELVQRQAQAFTAQGVDTFVLGCTHFAFLAPAIQQAVGTAVQIIEPGPVIAKQIQQHQDRLTTSGKQRYYTTESSPRFQQLAAKLLDKEIDVAMLK